ncbi:MAG: hypothetical protein OZ948_03790 [Deltaproteobacteria bacterium]|nr:hypothetical protein [Deltaproteobacteria bacterium]
MTDRDDGVGVARVRAELVQLGVGEPACEELARRLAPMIRGLSGEAYAAALAGAALTHGVQRGQQDALRHSLRDLVEVQRLLGAFGEELCRLEEALRMLSREVQQSRVQVTEPPSRRIH